MSSETKYSSSAQGSGTAAAPAMEKVAQIPPIATTGPETSPVLEGNIIYGDVPDQEEIRQLAYSYWEARGYQGGSAEEDWLRAEQEIRSRETAGN